jgi:hypothetical protein
LNRSIVVAALSFASLALGIILVTVSYRLVACVNPVNDYGFCGGWSASTRSNIGFSLGVGIAFLVISAVGFFLAFLLSGRATTKGGTVS